MACFLVPAAEAIVTAIAAKVMKSNKKQPETVKVQPSGTDIETAEKLSFSRKLKWLSNLLWGGSALLAFEHIWHGEVVPWFPFITAAGDSAGTAQMFNEMATVGVAMAGFVTAVWIGITAVASAAEKKAIKRPLNDSGAQ